MAALVRRNKMAGTVAVEAAGQGVPGKFHCNYCLSDCSGLRVKCAECPDFDLCLQCFSTGAEMGNHKRGHSYQLMDNGTFSIAYEDWCGEEEVLLLDAVEQHGLGNWDDIADHIGTKTPQDHSKKISEIFIIKSELVDLLNTARSSYNVESASHKKNNGSGETQLHYETMYLDRNIAKVTLPKGLSDIPDHTSNNGQLSPTLRYPPEPLELPMTEQQELGYMPLRDDFERDYENEAETLIRSLVCNRDDDDLDTALKLAHTDMYWRVAKERKRRKLVARQYGLITSKHKLIASRRKLTKEDREFRDHLRVFAQLTTPTEWDECLNNRIRTGELKARIKDLSRYRRNGIKKLSGCREYDELRFQREKKKENRKRLQIVSPPRTTKSSQFKKEDDADDDKPSYETDGSGSFIDCDELMRNDSSRSLLSDKEKKLCHSMDITCSRYLTIKGLVLKEYCCKAQGIHTKNRPTTGISSDEKTSISHFLKSCGWLPSD